MLDRFIAEPVLTVAFMDMVFEELGFSFRGGRVGSFIYPSFTGTKCWRVNIARKRLACHPTGFFRHR